MTAPDLPELHLAEAVAGHRIAVDDTVRLGVLRAPRHADDTSVLLEVWDPGGAQPPNSHPRSVETFWFVHGTGVATCDGVEYPVAAGQFLVLPPGSLHHIRNTGAGRLYAITTMTPDDGFAGVVERGPLDLFDADDLAVFTGAARSADVRAKM